MRMVIQKAERASVTVDGIIQGEIGNGLMVLVGLLSSDESDYTINLQEKGDF